MQKNYEHKVYILFTDKKERDIAYVCRELKKKKKNKNDHVQNSSAVDARSHSSTLQEHEAIFYVEERD